MNVLRSATRLAFGVPLADAAIPARARRVWCAAGIVEHPAHSTRGAPESIQPRGAWANYIQNIQL